MRVLVVGAGGREHALVWQLRGGQTAAQVYAAPGNPCIAPIARCLPIDPSDILRLAASASELQIDLTVVGPEAPLAAGIVDAFQAQRLRIFGPAEAAAQIESSKVFAKQLMARCDIPTAPFEVFTSPADAMSYARALNRPQVVKADGLTAGKGVVVCNDSVEAERAIFDLMVARKFGDAGSRIVIEERLTGSEASILALVGPRGVVPLLPAQDYKRAFDGDQGPNTGGMGAIVPGMVPPAVAAEVVEAIIEPALWAMEREGRPYAGVLYAGVMVTDDGPKALEFNCRFGDPETQAILPLLDSDLTEAMIDLLDGRTPSLRWKDGAAACVVLASRGYPGHAETGRPILGLDDAGGVLVFHAGTAESDGRPFTAGGRVLNVVGTGDTLEDAVDRAYTGVARIHFDGMHYRRDIGRRVSVAEEVTA
ncbi:MAG: phosphoribosylamine--glycine ligase [Armatimonadetes bacterium]|nr:phosphoribosylamine--glycine ligase [Armatimonadota bacterium]